MGRENNVGGVTCGWKEMRKSLPPKPAVTSVGFFKPARYRSPYGFALRLSARRIEMIFVHFFPLPVGGFAFEHEDVIAGRHKPGRQNHRRGVPGA